MSANLLTKELPVVYVIPPLEYAKCTPAYEAKFDEMNGLKSAREEPARFREIWAEERRALARKKPRLP